MEGADILDVRRKGKNLVLIVLKPQAKEGAAVLSAVHFHFGMAGMMKVKTPERGDPFRLYVGKTPETTGCFSVRQNPHR